MVDRAILSKPPGVPFRRRGLFEHELVHGNFQGIGGSKPGIFLQTHKIRLENSVRISSGSLCVEIIGVFLNRLSALGASLGMGPGVVSQPLCRLVVMIEGRSLWAELFTQGLDLREMFEQILAGVSGGLLVNYWLLARNQSVGIYDIVLIPGIVPMKLDRIGKYSSL